MCAEIISGNTTNSKKQKNNSAHCKVAVFGIRQVHTHTLYCVSFGVRFYYACRAARMCCVRRACTFLFLFPVVFWLGWAKNVYRSCTRAQISRARVRAARSHSTIDRRWLARATAHVRLCVCVCVCWKRHVRFAAICLIYLPFKTHGESACARHFAHTGCATMAACSASIMFALAVLFFLYSLSDSCVRISRKAAHIHLINRTEIYSTQRAAITRVRCDGGRIFNRINKHQLCAAQKK